MPYSSSSSPRAVLLAAGIMLLGSVMSIGASTAGAASFTMPLTTYGGLALDEAHGQMFVSGGDSVAVRSLDGSAKATLGGLVNAGGMVISGSTLYVAQCGISSIATFDTATLGAGPSISLGTEAPRGPADNPARPCTLTKAAGRLWFSDSATSGSIASVNLSTGAVQTFMPNAFYGAVIASNPANSNQIVIASGSSHPTDIGVYDVDPAVGTPTLAGSIFRAADGTEVNDIRFTPTGTSLLVTRANVLKLDASTKADQTSYAIGTSPVAGVPSADGSWVVGGRGTLTGSGPDIYVFPDGGGLAPNLYELGTGMRLSKGAIAMSSDNSRVYGIATTSSSTVPTLFAFAAPTVGASTLTISGPPSSSTVWATTLSGSLRYSGDGSVEARDVTVRATPPNGPEFVLGSTTTSATGAWSLTAFPDTLTAGTWTFTASSAASAPYPSSSATRTVYMTPPETELSLTAPTTIAAGAGASLSGLLEYVPNASADGRTVTISATAPSGGSAAPLGNAVTAASGSWTFTIAPGALGGAGAWTISAAVATNGSYPAVTTEKTINVAASAGGDSGGISGGTGGTTTGPVGGGTSVGPTPPPAPPAPTTTPPTTTVNNPPTTVVVVVIRPTSRNDRLIGRPVADIIRALAGNDTIRGGGGNDQLFGDAGSDQVFGEAGNDRIVGGAGRDVLNGGVGNDTIDAADHARGDTVRCGAGRDVVVANAGDVVAKDCEKVTRRS